MKKLLTLIALVATLTGPVLGALTPAQLSRLREQLSNADPRVRVAAFEDLLKTNLVTAGNDIVPLLSKATQDPDERVRASAAASLAAIALSTSPKFRTVAE